MTKKPFHSMSDDFDELSRQEERAFAEEFMASEPSGPSDRTTYLSISDTMKLWKKLDREVIAEASKPEEQYMVVEKWEKDPLTGGVVYSLVSAEPASKPIVDTKPSTINDKPREWWIIGDKAMPNGHIVPDRYLSGDLVIEKSAYRYAVDQWDYWVEEARKAQSERDALKAENERLKTTNRRLDENCTLFNVASQYNFDQLEKLKAEAEKLVEAIETALNDEITVGQADKVMCSALTNWKRYREATKGKPGDLEGK